MKTVLKHKSVGVLIFVQGIMILFYGLFTTYGRTLDPNDRTTGGMEMYYPMFQDVHVMMFIGFGYLYVYLGKYGFSSASFNFLIGAFILQWSILVLGFWDQVGLEHHEWEKIELGITNLITGDYAVAAVLISFGAVIGKLTPEQLLFMGFIETIIYGGNEWIGVKGFGATDIGGSMYIHTFGAYFGLAVSFVTTKKEAKGHKNNISTYTSDNFALIGTIFLWMFWPSFNAAMAPLASQQHRVVVNTVLSLSVSCFATFVWSYLTNNGQFGMVEIQNATLAGGVAVGASADLVVGPWGAMLIGFSAGTVSAFGFKYLSPLLEKTIGLHDTAGIHNLHGLPGIIGGLASVFSSLIADRTAYGISIGFIFPRRAPSNVTEAAAMGLAPGEDRSAGHQSGYQMATLVVSICLGLLGGFLVGLILRSPLFSPIEPKHYYSDTKYWHIPEHGFPKDRRKSKKEQQEEANNKNEDSSSSATPSETDLPNVVVTVPSQINTSKQQD